MNESIWSGLWIVRRISVQPEFTPPASCFRGVTSTFLSTDPIAFDCPDVDKRIWTRDRVYSVHSCGRHNNDNTAYQEESWRMRGIIPSSRACMFALEEENSTLPEIGP